MQHRTVPEHPKPTPIEQLEAEVLNLPATERSRLLDKLLASLDVNRSVEDAWMAEARRRDDEIESGIVPAIPGDVAIARLRAGLE